MNVHPFTDPDVDRIAGLRPEGWTDITPVFRFYIDAPFCLPFKIEDGEAIIALGTAILLGRTAWLAHIIVAEPFRRRGLGRTMVRALIDCAEENDRGTQLLLATEMGAPLYETLGFRRTCDYGFFGRKDAVAEPTPDRDPADVSSRDPATPTGHDPDGIAPSLRAFGPEDAAGILALDREATGEDREVLLQWQGRRGWVFPDPDSGIVRGFYLPDLGDGMIAAADVEAGSRLMEFRMTRSPHPPGIPLGNRAAIDALAALGFELKRTAPRMVRNGEDPLRSEMIFNRAGGHLG